MLDDNTPVIVGVGQFAERLESEDYKGLSAVEIAVEASKAAFDDALSLEAIGPLIDLISTTRTFEDSAPHLAFALGKSNNFPRSICKRLGIDPAYAIWEDVGGNTPQKLVSEACERIAAGDNKAVLLCGAEAISTARHLEKQGARVDWAETIDAQVEDRHGHTTGMLSGHARKHGLLAAPPLYGLCENAKRAATGLSRDAYRLKMGEWFAPFTHIAATNPYASMANREYSAEELATVTEKNRLIADPYPRLMVSRDQVNQGAAVIVTSAGTAKQLGISEDKWVYLHGYAQVEERALEERQDLGKYPAAERASKAAMAAAGVSNGDIEVIDLYSCFPIAVSSVADILGVAADDPRGLTVTGGLPFFGGPGNNYSMHAIASVVEKLRASPGSYGFVGANGGFLSKYATGIYSTRPAAFKVYDSKPLQAEHNAMPAPAFTETPSGEATIETFTMIYNRDGSPGLGVIIGRLKEGNVRFLASTEKGDSETASQMVDREPLGATVFVTTTDQGNRFVFSPPSVMQQGPAPLHRV